MKLKIFAAILLCLMAAGCPEQSCDSPSSPSVGNRPPTPPPTTPAPDCVWGQASWDGLDWKCPDRPPRVDANFSFDAYQ
ncbi:MAG: hypothetical protein ACREIS_06380, partial [Nitrospiraceae bacterium]